jgi:hypothetical protein
MMIPAARAERFVTSGFLVSYAQPWDQMDSAIPKYEPYPPPPKNAKPVEMTPPEMKGTALTCSMSQAIAGGLWEARQ